jgi:hypothetical protein
MPIRSATFALFVLDGLIYALTSVIEVFLKRYSSKPCAASVA